MAELYEDLSIAERMQHIDVEARKLVALALKMGIHLRIDPGEDAPFDASGVRHVVHITVQHTPGVAP